MDEIHTDITMRKAAEFVTGEEGRKSMQVIKWTTLCDQKWQERAQERA